MGWSADRKEKKEKIEDQELRPDGRKVEREVLPKGMSANLV